MKHLIVCCDGTWQTLRQPEPTNIAKIAMHLTNVNTRDRAPQVVYYDSGVGAAFEADDANPFDGIGDAVKKLLGGAIGDGLEEKIFDAYRFLAFNYVEGDRIYIFGFSRGAFTARSLCGLIYNSGLVSRDKVHLIDDAYQLYRADDVKPWSEKSVAFRAANGARRAIDFLGCFDTVGMNGMPNLFDRLPLDRFFNREHGFHDCKLNHTIKYARHACALDENRKLFPVTLMQASDKAGPEQVDEMWFPGHHGGIGGGEAEGRPFADAALLWMIQGAERAGLTFRDAVFEQAEPDPLAEMIRPEGMRRAGERTRQLPKPYERLQLHQGVRARYYDRAKWRPDALKPLFKILDEGEKDWRQATQSPDLREEDTDGA